MLSLVSLMTMATLSLGTCGSPRECKFSQFVFNFKGIDASFRYVPPDAEESQDIMDASLTREDGINILKFKKKIDSGDERVIYL